jgi:hypothetical protein
MKKLLWLFLKKYFHTHKYEIIKEISVWSDYNPHAQYPMGHEYILQCTKCGKIKIKRDC